MVTPCRDLAAGGRLGTAVQREVGTVSIVGIYSRYGGYGGDGGDSGCGGDGGDGGHGGDGARTWHQVMPSDASVLLSAGRRDPAFTRSCGSHPFCS